MHKALGRLPPGTSSKLPAGLAQGRYQSPSIIYSAPILLFVLGYFFAPAVMSGFDLLVSLYSSENFFSMATLSFPPSTKNNLLFDFLRYFDFRLAEHSFNSVGFIRFRVDTRERDY